MERGGVGLGRHIIAEFYGCKRELLDDIRFIKHILIKAAILSNSTVIGYGFHRFKPHGVSGYVLVAESHLSIHTWPEYGYAAVDIFTCGEHTNPNIGLAELQKQLEAKKVVTTELIRGLDVRSKISTKVDNDIEEKFSREFNI